MTANPTPETTLRVLVVDDAPENLLLISALLAGEYQVSTAENGSAGLLLACATPRPDMILLDVMMPDIDGYEVCRQLKADPATHDIPVIFLTARHDTASETTGFALGAVDFIVKPVNPPVLLSRVRSHLQAAQFQSMLRDQNAFLEEAVTRRTQDVRAMRDIAIMTMSSLAEIRDNETGNHIRRTQHYVQALARRLRDHRNFSGFLNDLNILRMFKSAPLHDIGKIGIPDHILHKPGKLTPEEFEIMKHHPELGVRAIERAELEFGQCIGFLQLAKQIVGAHHEKWDGSGYPHGLAGDTIPIPGRLMALADVYDALISRRVYKPPLSHAEVLEIIRENRGSHFDPDIVDAFLAISDEFAAIHSRFTDEPSERS